MKFIKIKCSKCGYEIEVPDTTTSVICGSCGEINHISKISSILKKYGETAFDIEENTTPDIKTTYSRTGRQNIPPIPVQQKEETPPSENDETDYPEEKNAVKIITLIFILTPFIAIIMEYFKLPSYTAIIFIIAIILIIFILKKRS